MVQESEGSALEQRSLAITGAPLLHGPIVAKRGDSPPARKPCYYALPYTEHRRPRPSINGNHL